LLFTTREPKRKPGITGKGAWAKWYRFEGAFVVAAWQWVTPTQGPRAGDALLRFSLVPCEASAATAGEQEDVAVPQKATAVELRELLRTVGAGEPQKGIYKPKEYILRSQLIRAYALARAAGVCELCDCKAPFHNGNGEPFLEVHHLHRLAGGGPDDPGNVAAICPNCHREAHHGMRRDQIADTLTQRVRSTELRIASLVSNGGTKVTHR
jgi:5-methylcytosine-specific restriction protein A